MKKKYIKHGIFILLVIVSIAFACLYLLKLKVRSENDLSNLPSNSEDVVSNVIAYIADDPGRRHGAIHIPFRKVVLNTGKVYKCVSEDAGFTVWSTQLSDEVFHEYAAGIKKLRLADFEPALYAPPDGQSVTIGIWTGSRYVYYSWTGQSQNLPASLQVSFPAAWAEAIDAFETIPGVNWKMESKDAAMQQLAKIDGLSR